MARLDEEQLNQVKEVVVDALREFDTLERYTIKKGVQVFDGRNFQFGRTTGTKFGTGTDQLISFYNATPVNQPDTIGDPGLSTVSGTGDDSTINTNFSILDSTVELIIDRLQELGLIA